MVFCCAREFARQRHGQQILTQLIEKYKGQTCVLDMESPTQVCENIEQRRRRHDFYLRNGFRDTNVYRTYRHRFSKSINVRHLNDLILQILS